MNTPLLFHGPIITPETPRSAKYIPHALLYVRDGIIQWIEADLSPHLPMAQVLRDRALQDVPVRRLRKGEFLIPGFVDTHTHAPQFNNIGRGGQLQLLDWLNEFTFPLESKFRDKAFAEKTYSRVVRRTLDCGTTTCCYFGASHLIGNTILADIVKANGQRAFIGKCNMNRHAPQILTDSSVKESLQATRDLISYIDALDTPLVQPILTPRFAISCTDELLEGLGEMAKASAAPDNRHPIRPQGLAIQTHISENLTENEFTASLFPGFRSYAEIYDGFGLLGPTTILAHGCHLSRDELTLIKNRGAGISHCPTSNLNLTSGLARVGEWLDEGVKVGLGTDVSGGFSPSMLTAINHASITSKILAMQAPSDARNTPPPTTNTSSPKPFANRSLPTAALLHIATLGGAELCNLEKITGSLVTGKAFDAVLVNLRDEPGGIGGGGNPGVWWDDHDDDLAANEVAKDDSNEGECARLEAWLEKFFSCGDDRNIAAVWVEGRLVGGREYDASNTLNRVYEKEVISAGL